MKKGEAIVILGHRNKFTAFAVRLGPRSLVRKVAHALQAGN